MLGLSLFFKIHRC